MPHAVRITLEGYPEVVNEIARSLEAAAPGVLEWRELGLRSTTFEILLEGIATLRSRSLFDVSGIADPAGGVGQGGL